MWSTYVKFADLAVFNLNRKFQLSERVIFDAHIFHLELSLADAEFDVGRIKAVEVAP